MNGVGGLAMRFSILDIWADGYERIAHIRLINSESEFFVSFIEHDEYINSGKSIRACSHKTNAQIFEQIFAGCKAKICRRTGVRQKFLTPQTAKFAGKMCVWPYVNRP